MKKTRMKEKQNSIRREGKEETKKAEKSHEGKTRIGPRNRGIRGGKEH